MSSPFLSRPLFLPHSMMTSCDIPGVLVVSLGMKQVPQISQTIKTTRTLCVLHKAPMPHKFFVAHLQPTTLHLTYNLQFISLLYKVWYLLHQKWDMHPAWRMPCSLLAIMASKKVINIPICWIASPWSWCPRERFKKCIKKLHSHHHKHVPVANVVPDWKACSKTIGVRAKTEHEVT